MRSNPRALVNWLLIMIAIVICIASYPGSRATLLAFTGDRGPASSRLTSPIRPLKAEAAKKTRNPRKGNSECKQSADDKSGKGHPAPARPAASAPAMADTQAGNSIYRIYVDAAGRYTATTGPNHPAGNGLNVLFGEGKPGTTFNTIRSYTTNTDYTQSLTESSSNSISLAQFATVTANGTFGITTTYDLPGPPTTPDAMTIVQDVKVNGTTFSDSTIEVTTTIINRSGSPVDIGIRYLMDYQIGGDDGPTFQELGPDGGVRTTETEFLNPGFVQYRITDNDLNPISPTFFVLGTTSGPLTMNPQPTRPDLLQYTCWSRSSETLFDYTVSPALSVANNSDCGGAGGDAAVIYYFGRNRANAIRVAGGGRSTVSASMFPSLTANVDLAVTQTATPNPVAPGSNVTYNIRVTNNDSQNTATFVTLTSNLPANTTFVSCAAPGGVCGGTGNNRVVTFPSLAPGTSGQVTLVATANCTVGSDGTVINTVTASSSTPDQNPADNIATTTVNLSSAPGSIAIMDGRTALDFGTVPAARVASQNPPSDTFTIANSGCATVLLNFGINRTGSDVDRGRIINTDDSAIFQMRIVNGDGTETPLSISPGSSPVQIPGGQNRRYRVLFNPLIPILAGKTTGLFANQVLPDVVTSQLRITPSTGSPLSINLTGHISTPVQMINPSDSRLEPLILFTRSGDEFTVESSTHDSNLDLYLARFQFLDQNNSPVGDPVDADLMRSIAQGDLVKGQSFTMIQKFLGAASVPQVTKVRITLYDRETNITANPAVLGATPPALASVSAASFNDKAIASASIVSTFGNSLATTTQAATTTPLPDSLAGVTLKVRDGSGKERPAPLFFVSPGQVNFQIPEGTMVGAATLTLSKGDGAVVRDVVQITDSSPGLFAANANGQGAAAAVMLRITRDGKQIYEPVAEFDAAQQRFNTRPLNLENLKDQHYLVLFGTGVRFRRSLSDVKVRIGGLELPVLYAGPHQEFVGLDQVNVALPSNLAGRGEIEVTVTVDGKASNTVKVNVGGQSSSALAISNRAEGIVESDAKSQPSGRESRSAILLPTLRVAPSDRGERGQTNTGTRRSNKMKE